MTIEFKVQFNYQTSTMNTLSDDCYATYTCNNENEIYDNLIKYIKNVYAPNSIELVDLRYTILIEKNECICYHCRQMSFIPLRQDGFGNFVCMDCLSSMYTLCAFCNEYFENDEVQIGLKDEKLCNDCFSDLYFICDDCGNVTANDDCYHVYRDGIVCNDCYEDNYFYCECCDTYYPNERQADCDCGYCYDCCECDNDYGCFVQNHRYSFTTYKHENDDGIMLGIEMEFSNGDIYNFTDKLVESREFKDDLYIKDDGTVDVEFNFNPMTITHVREYPFDKLFSLVNRYGIGNNNAGLHIHVDRQALGLNLRNLFPYVSRRWNSEDSVAYTPYRIFMSKYRDELQVIGKRHSSYGKFYSTYNSRDWSDRYSCFNVCPRETVEFRFPKMPIVYDEFIGIVETIYGIVTYCKQYNFITVYRQSFNHFVNHLENKGLNNALIYYRKIGIIK